MITSEEAEEILELIENWREKEKEKTKTQTIECAKDSIVNPAFAGRPEYKAAYEVGAIEDIYDSSTNIYNRHR